jgi:hypothetical protein
MTKNPIKAIEFAIDLHARIFIHPSVETSPVNDTPAPPGAHALGLLTGIPGVL